MPTKNNNIELNMNNMSFTDQRNFVKVMLNNTYTAVEIFDGYSSKQDDFEPEHIINSIKKASVSPKQKERILGNFSKSNLIIITRNQIANIKNFIKNGKLDDNIQTDKNIPGTPEYEEFHLSPLENMMVGRINRMSDNKKDSILKYNPTDKEIISSFISSLDEKDLKNTFIDLRDQLFTYKIIKVQDHDYNPEKEKEKGNESNRELDQIANKGVTDKRLWEEMHSKDDSDSVRDETKKENVIKYVSILKEMTDAISDKPWYIRWFSSAYKKQINALESAKDELYKRGISKSSLNKFLKSKGDEKDINKFYNSNEAKINEINEKNNKLREERIAKQEDINIKNFFKEQEIAKNAHVTLDKITNKELESDKEKVDEDIDFDKEIEILESSDDLQERLDEEFDLDFTKETLDAFKKEDNEIINEKEI